MNAVQQLLTDHIDIWTAAETEKRSGRGRASSSAASVYGIVKLRELILTLAVRGKLIPQNPSDEPASSLIQEVQKNKAKLISEGKIAKEKQLTAITESEKKFNLPAGWDWVRFCDYATDIATGPFGSMIHQSDYIRGGVPLINPSHMVNDTIVPDESITIAHDMAKTLSAYAIYDGDIVMARRGEVGRIALVTKSESGWLCGTGSFLLRFYKEIPRNYLRLLFRSEFVRSFLVGQSVGTTMVNLNHGILKKMPVCIPPLAEQHRIVAKVDELMALCDQLEAQHSDAADAHEQLVSQLLGTLTQSQCAADFNTNWQRIAVHFDTLFTTEASIDALKQTLLQLAVMGKLVAQEANDEPASELLKRIVAEKAKLVAEGKISKEKSLPLITSEEKFIELPLGWHWARFCDYATDIATGPFGSMIHQADYIQGGVPLINPSHMINDKIVPDRDISVTIEIAESLNAYTIYKGDIVMARRGEVGRIALVTENENGWLCGTGSFVLRFCDEVSRNYLRLLFRSEFVRSFLAGEAVGTTMVNLNHGILKKMPICIPPLAEQHRIVAKIDELMNMCNQLRSSITGANQQQQKLADVLVEHAVVR